MLRTLFRWCLFLLRVVIIFYIAYIPLLIFLQAALANYVGYFAYESSALILSLFSLVLLLEIFSGKIRKRFGAYILFPIERDSFPSY